MHREIDVHLFLSYNYFEFSGTTANPTLTNTEELVYNIRAHREKYHLAVGMMRINSWGDHVDIFGRVRA